MDDSKAPEKDELREHRLAALRADIQVAVDQADGGRISSFNDETLREARMKGRERIMRQS